MPDNIHKLNIKDISDTDKHIRLSDYVMHIHTLHNKIRERRKLGLQLGIKQAEYELQKIDKDIEDARNALDDERGLSMEELVSISTSINMLIKKYPYIFNLIEVDKAWQ
jgi:hypothetical protein